jgi:hypothetical protein
MRLIRSILLFTSVIVAGVSANANVVCHNGNVTDSYLASNPDEAFAMGRLPTQPAFNLAVDSTSGHYVAQLNPQDSQSNGPFTFHKDLTCSFSTNDPSLSSCSGTQAGYFVTVAVAKEVRSIVEHTNSGDHEHIDGKYTVSMKKEPLAPSAQNRNGENLHVVIEYKDSDCTPN